MVCCSLLISLLQCLTSMIVEYILVSDEWYIILIINIFQFWAEFPFPGFYLWFDQINKKIFLEMIFVPDVPRSGADVDPRQLRQLLRRVRGAGPARPRPQLPRQPGLRHHLHPLPGAAVLCCIVLNIVLYSTVMWIFFPGLTLHTQEGQDEKTGH